MWSRKYEENCCYFNTDVAENDYLTSGWNKSLECEGGWKIFLKINNLLSTIIRHIRVFEIRYNQSKKFRSTLDLINVIHTRK